MREERSERSRQGEWSARRFLQCAVGLVAVLVSASPVSALQIRLVGEGGEPLVGARVAVAGRQGTLVADGSGAVTVEPMPELPFTLLVARPDGVALAPITVSEVPDGAVVEVAVTSGYQESIGVISSVVPDVELPPASAFTLVGRAELERRTPMSLAAALDVVPGAWRSGDGRDAVPSLRGLASGRTVLLLDEGRVAAERRAGPSATFLDPETIDEVEVIRGPGAVAYGSDAFGGVIRARTRLAAAGEPLNARASVGLGSGSGDRAGMAVVSGTVAGGGVLLGVARRYSDGYESALGPVPNSSYGTSAVWLGFQRAVLGGNARLIWRHDRASDVGKPSSVDELSRTYYPTEASDRLSAHLDRAGPGRWTRLGATVSWDRYRIVTTRDRTAPAGGAGSGEESQVQAEDWALRFEAERALGRGRLLLGLDLSGRFGLRALNRVFDLPVGGGRAAVVEEVAVNDARRADTGAFLAVVQDWHGVGVSAGLRGDRVTSHNRGGFFGDQSASWSRLSGFAAVTVRPCRGLEVTAQAARGFRDALLSDRYFRGVTGRGWITGNPDLRPETSRQLDVAVRYGAGPLGLAAFGYSYRISDLIERFRESGEYRFRNRGEAEIRGVEVEGSVELGKDTRVELGAQLLRGTVHDDHQPPDGMPPRGTRVTVRRGGARWSWFASAAALGRRSRPGPTEREVPGWAVVDAGATVATGHGWRIDAVGRNLLAQEYSSSADEGAPLSPGRVLELRLRWEL